MKQHEQELPGGLATELRQLAETETTGTQPFPRMNEAIQRSRRVRFARYGGAALATGVAAVVIGVEVLAGGAFDRAQEGTPVAPTPSVSASLSGDPTTPEGAGYPAQTQGSLADDEAWLNDLRTAVQANDDDVEQIRVVAAGDIQDSARYAVVLVYAPRGQESPWTREIWIGEAGVPVSEMNPVSTGEGDGRKVPNSPMAVFATPDFAEDAANPVVVVSAPGAQEVTVTSGRTYSTSKGKADVGWQSRSVQPAGTGVWTATLRQEEYFISEATVDGERASSMTRAGGLNLTEVAAPGTDLEDLAWLSGAISSTFPNQSPTLAETPVYAGTAPAGEGQVVAALLRTPDGEHLYAFAEHQRSEAPDASNLYQSSGLLPRGTDSADVMAGVVTTHDGLRRYLVLVPEGTARIRVGDKTAEVTGRLAVLDLESPGGKVVTKKTEALASDGSVLASITPPSEPVTEAEMPADYAGDVTSIRM